MSDSDDGEVQRVVELQTIGTFLYIGIPTDLKD